MSQLGFYALEDDIRALLEAVERRCPVHFIQTGNNSRNELSRYSCSRDIPDLGVATSDTGSTSDSYLVAPVGTDFETRTITTNDGEKRFLIDQLANPGTVVLTPAGRRGDDTILAGRVGTASDNAQSRTLMRRFKRVFAASFSRVAAFYVGPSALRALRAGARLTISIGAARSFDLTPGPPR